MDKAFIGITGQKYSGKNTAALAFEALGFEPFSFALPIKLMIGEFLSYQGLNDDLIWRMLEGDLKEVPTPYLQGRTPRYAMQTLGTEWGRQLMGDAIWVDALLAASADTPMKVVTDVRFPNEVEALRAHGAQIFRVVRPDNPLNTGGDLHASEAYIANLEVDQEIMNTAASAEEFVEQVATFFTKPIEGNS